MEYLYLGLMIPKSDEKKYLKKIKKGAQGAANTFQWNLLDGFVANSVSMTVYNTVPVGTYPRKCKQLFFHNRKWNYESFECLEIGFINLPVIKQLVRESIYFSKIKKWIKNTSKEKTIIIYSLYTPYLKLAKKIKQRFPEVKICCIVTDLPGKYGFEKRNSFKKCIKNLYYERAIELSNNVDCFVLLTEQMKGPLLVSDRSYVIVEGICNDSIISNIRANSSNKKIMLYTGTLDSVFGILEFLEAFKKTTNKNYEFWICGSGNAEKEIIEASSLDRRIVYKGFMTKDEIYKLQQRSTVLVNPRKNNGEYTKYSFPSKTLEYMISGKPVLMYKLDGIPKEYDNYLYYILGESVEDAHNRIEQILNLSENERLKKGEAARDFVLKNKNGYIQAKKIINMIEQI